MNAIKHFCINLRPPHQASELTNLLATKGAQVLEFPTLEVTTNKKTLNIGEGWVAATSANAFRFLEDTACLKNAKIAVIGGHTGMFAKQMGFEPSYVSEIAQSGSFGDSLGRYLNSLGVDQLTFLRGNNAGDDFPKAIEKYGIFCDNVTVYNVKKVTKTEQQLTELNNFIDQVSPSSIALFATSSMAVESFVEQLEKISEDVTKRILLNAKVIVIGPKTSERSKKLGFRNVVLSEEVSVEEMVSKLCSL